MQRRAMTGDPSGPAGPDDPGVTLGQIAGPFGVRGWVKVKSYTEPVEDILRFPAWQTKLPGGGTRVLKPLEGRRHGEMVVARLEGVVDRDEAGRLARCDVSVPRSALPPLPAGEHYRADLEGLDVLTTTGVVLGRLDHFVETPANAIMVVIGERERWLPLVPQYVKSVDLAARRIVVDWDPDF